MPSNKNLILFLLSFLISFPILGQNLQSLNVNVKIKITNSIGIKTVEKSELSNMENNAETNLDLSKNNQRELLIQYYSRQKRNNNYSNSHQQTEHSVEKIPDLKIFNNKKEKIGLLCCKNTNLISKFSPNEELVFAYSENNLEYFSSRDLAITIIY